MPISIGTSTAKKVYFGTTEIKKIFSGTNQVWSSGYTTYLIARSQSSVTSPEKSQFIKYSSGSLSSVLLNSYITNDVSYLEMVGSDAFVFAGNKIVKINTNNMTVTTSATVSVYFYEDQPRPFVAGDEIYFLNNTGSFHKLNKTTLAFTEILSEANHKTLIGTSQPLYDLDFCVDNGHVFIGSADAWSYIKVIKINLTTHVGTLVYNNPNGRSVQTGPQFSIAVSGDILAYLGWDGSIISLNLNTPTDDRIMSEETVRSYFYTTGYRQVPIQEFKTIQGIFNNNIYITCQDQSVISGVSLTTRVFTVASLVSAKVSGMMANVVEVLPYTTKLNRFLPVSSFTRKHLIKEYNSNIYTLHNNKLIHLKPNLELLNDDCIVGTKGGISGETALSRLLVAKDSTHYYTYVSGILRKYTLDGTLVTSISKYINYFNVGFSDDNYLYIHGYAYTMSSSNGYMAKFAKSNLAFVGDVYFRIYTNQYGNPGLSILEFTDYFIIRSGTSDNSIGVISRISKSTLAVADVYQATGSPSALDMIKVNNDILIFRNGNRFISYNVNTATFKSTQYSRTNGTTYQLVFAANNYVYLIGYDTLNTKTTIIKLYYDTSNMELTYVGINQYGIAPVWPVQNIQIGMDGDRAYISKYFQGPYEISEIDLSSFTNIKTETSTIVGVLSSMAIKNNQWLLSISYSNMYDTNSYATGNLYLELNKNNYKNISSLNVADYMESDARNMYSIKDAIVL